VGLVRELNEAKKAGDKARVICIIIFLERRFRQRWARPKHVEIADYRENKAAVALPFLDNDPDGENSF